MNPMYRKNRNRLNNRPTTHRLRRGFALYAVAALACCLATPALAAGDPLAVIDNLNTFIFSIIRAVGLILLGWGIVQVGLSLQSHDPSQRSPRPQSAQPGFSDAGGRHHHHVCP